MSVLFVFSLILLSSTINAATSRAAGAVGAGRTGAAADAVPSIAAALFGTTEGGATHRSFSLFSEPIAEAATPPQRPHALVTPRQESQAGNVANMSLALPHASPIQRTHSFGRPYPSGSPPTERWIAGPAPDTARFVHATGTALTASPVAGTRSLAREIPQAPELWLRPQAQHQVRIPASPQTVGARATATNPFAASPMRRVDSLEGFGGAPPAAAAPADSLRGATIHRMAISEALAEATARSPLAGSLTMSPVRRMDSPAAFGVTPASSPAPSLWVTSPTHSIAEASGSRRRALPRTLPAPPQGTAADSNSFFSTDFLSPRAADPEAVATRAERPAVAAPTPSGEFRFDPDAEPFVFRGPQPADEGVASASPPTVSHSGLLRGPPPSMDSFYRSGRLGTTERGSSLHMGTPPPPSAFEPSGSGASTLQTATQKSRREAPVADTQQQVAHTEKTPQKGLAASAPPASDALVAAVATDTAVPLAGKPRKAVSAQHGSVADTPPGSSKAKTGRGKKHQSKKASKPKQGDSAGTQTAAKAAAAPGKKPTSSGTTVKDPTPAKATTPGNRRKPFPPPKATAAPGKKPTSSGTTVKDPTPAKTTTPGNRRKPFPPPKATAAPGKKPTSSGATVKDPTPAKATTPGNRRKPFPPPKATAAPGKKPTSFGATVKDPTPAKTPAAPGKKPKGSQATAQAAPKLAPPSPVKAPAAKAPSSRSGKRGSRSVATSRPKVDEVVDGVDDAALMAEFKDAWKQLAQMEQEANKKAKAAKRAAGQSTKKRRKKKAGGAGAEEYSPPPGIDYTFHAMELKDPERIRIALRDFMSLHTDDPRGFKETYFDDVILGIKELDDETAEAVTVGMHEAAGKTYMIEDVLHEFQRFLFNPITDEWIRHKTPSAQTRDAINFKRWFLGTMKQDEYIDFVGFLERLRDGKYDKIKWWEA